MSQDSHLADTESLQSEGCWAEAARRRDQVRRQLRADGTPRQKEKAAPWAAMWARFSPSRPPNARAISFTIALAQRGVFDVPCPMSFPVKLHRLHKKSRPVFLFAGSITGCAFSRFRE